MKRVIGFFDRNNGFEDGAFAFLDPLSHGVEVCSEINCSGENAHAVLAFAFSVELLPPLVHVVKLRLEVNEDLNLFAGTIERIAHSGILRGNIIFGAALAFHVSCTFDEGVDIESCAGNGKKADGSEHRETSAHVVGDDERGVTLFVGRGARRALLGVGHRHDHLACSLFAALFLTLFLEETEGQCGLRGGAALGNVDHTEFAVAEVFAKFEEIVFADVVAGKEDNGIGAVVGEPFELVAECLNHSARSEVGTADTCNDNRVAMLTQCGSAGFDFAEEFGGDGRRKVHPAEEVVARAGLCLECFLCGGHIGIYFVQLAVHEERRGVVKF